MPPCMPLRFDIVERRCDHIAIKRAIRGQGFFFFHIFFLSFFLPLFPFSLSFSSTFSSFLGSFSSTFFSFLGSVF